MVGRYLWVNLRWLAPRIAFHFMPCSHCMCAVHFPFHMCSSFYTHVSILCVQVDQALVAGTDVVLRIDVQVWTLFCVDGRVHPYYGLVGCLVWRGC